MKSFELVVLGGGGASALAKKAGEAGVKTALIEMGPLGGTCPNRGCIPSKLLLQHATVAETVRRAPEFHLRVTMLGANTARIFAAMRSDISGTDRAVRESLGKNVKLFRGQGKFLGPRVVQVGGETLSGKRIVIATGTRPVRPVEPEGIENIPYWLSDDVFLQRRAPRSLVIVGGGYIACEFAHFFSALGTDVTMIVRGPELLMGEDGEVRKAFNKAFATRVNALHGATVVAVRRSRGRYRLTIGGKNKGTLASDALFYAIGRRPNTDALGIETTGVKLDARGFVRVDEHLETNVRGIYAVGDVNGRHLFTHAATVQNDYLAARLFARRRGPLQHGPMPHAVFTHPEVAGVGETEEALQERQVPYVKAVVRFGDLAKGNALKEKHGIAKLLASPSGTILGWHAVGPEASILLHQVVVAMRWRNHVTTLTGAITVHPSLNEVVTETAWQALDKLAPRA